MAEMKRRAGVKVSLTDHELTQVDRIVSVLRTRGYPQANRSPVIREALVWLSEQLHGKSPKEMMRFFVERRLPRPRAYVAPPRRLKPVAR